MARMIARLVAFTIALSACSSGKATRQHAEKPATSQKRLKEAEKLRDMARFTPARPGEGANRDYDVEGYALSGRFNWDALQLEGQVEITLKLADASITAIELDSRVTQINAVRIGEIHPAYTVDPNAGTLAIDLGRLTTEQREGRIKVSVSYVRKATENADSGEHFDGFALRAIVPRLGDPIKSRTVNTMSEPLSASQWMPCKDDVSDRATFAVELELPQDEALIANGNLIKDVRQEDGKRVMGYRTEYTIPTYLMAFAAGEFNVTTTDLNGLPIGVWSRRGLPVDSSGVIENLSRLITRFTELVGPYPFDKYMIVFLPEFGGGEEHAGITFQNEYDGSDTAGAGDLLLIGHELAHQWFGDYMTVETWDDLWIKEGMASLLEAESSRPWEDRKGKGNLFGSFQWVDVGDAIIDPALEPDAKYTSGPYGRAAWLLTQMRSILGDDQFFATLRQMLKDHAYGTITTAQFLDAFRPGLGDARVAKIEVALKAKALPTVNAEKTADGSVHLKLTDPDQSLVVPFAMIRLGDLGDESLTLVPGQDYVMDPNDDRPVIFDPKDVHCYQLRETAVSTVYQFLPAPLAPAKLLTLNNNDQTWALAAPADWTISAEEYTALRPELGGEIAKAKALQKACTTATRETDPSKKAAWAKAIDASLLDLPLLGLSSWYADTSFVALGECLNAATPGLLDTTFAQLQVNPTAFVTRPVYVETLATLPLEPELMLSTWAPVAKTGATLRLKAAAVSGLLRRLAALTPSDAVPVATLAPWQDLFRQLVAENHTSDVLRYSLQGVARTKDLDALPLLADVVRTVDLARLQKQAICAARKITDGTDGTFAGFAEPLLQLDLPKSVKHLLADAAGCVRER